MGVCPRCCSAVPLHEGRPVISTAGAIELWHPSCFAIRDSRGVEQVTVIAPAPRRRGVHVAAAGVAALAGLALCAAHVRPTHASTSLASPAATIDVAEHEVLPLKTIATTQENAPSLEARWPMPSEANERLDDLYPSLVDWIHPVTGSEEHMPEQASRHFGAERKGIMRAECGAGHCGVDLDGPRGRPIVAVADGTVVRVERHELGLDGRSGRYVRIEHDDGTLTAYMHLDDIADGLEVGDHVDGGQYIGTLGATAVYSAAPHLHFSLEIPNRAGDHGDNTNTHYVDPAPFLVRAKIVSIPERKHAIKPAM
ncbi:MAG: M23 family metallopeptidase [Deltaproteobacteria bacterium]|nr:M23 family metallopeptidase [Deltaproteobacteria bacterium]